jgi:acetyltransferase
VTAVPEDKPARPADLPAASSAPVLHAHSVTVRPLRREDADLELRFGLGLSDETRYSRFFGGVRFTPEMLASLVNIDFARDVALIATTTVAGHETPIGVARYVLAAEGDAAEFAITVADAWQGGGVGRMLLARLVEVARERGLRRLFGETLATNQAMIRLAVALGFQVSARAEDPTLRVLVRDLHDEMAAFVGRRPGAPDTEA